MATCARKARLTPQKWSAQSTTSALRESLRNARLAPIVRSLGSRRIQSASSALLAMSAHNSTLLGTSARPGSTASGRSVLSRMRLEHALLEESAQSNAPSGSIVQKALSRPLIAQLAPTKI
jgi:hypothetical protein